MPRTKKTLISAMCAALCAVLPMAFHMLPRGGSIISPMHIPVLLCGLVCGWPFGLLCGLGGPILSSFTTGMPPVATLPSMTVELAAYGGITGLLIDRVRTGNRYANLYISLLPAMLAGRVLAGLTRAFIISPGKYTFALWASSYFITALPGILIHLLLLPALVTALERARLIPKGCL